jgi:hypothetical protein
MDLSTVTAEMCRVCLKTRNNSKRFRKISESLNDRPIVEHLKDLSSNLKVKFCQGSIGTKSKTVSISRSP